jgi:hypothetical protein
LSSSDVPVAVSAPGRAGESWLERWSPIGGLLFVVGAVAVALTPAGDGTGDTVAEVVRFARDNDDWMAVALVFALASLLLLGWFVTGLYLQLRNAGARREAILAFVGGMILTLLFFLAVTIWSAPLVDIEENQATALAQGATYLAIDDVGWFALGGAGVGAGLMAIAASLGALRTRAVPAWAAWLGIVLGVAAFGTVAFLGLFAWLAWIVLASLAMLFGRGAARSV